MKNTRNAFTLVELIVVITILAILGTIAFISLQGYSADARNSKRTEDLNSIVKSIEIKVSNGSKLISFVGDSSSSSSTGIFSVAGTDVILDIDYKAGIPNYSAVGIKSTDFTDPSDASDYPIGITTKKDGEYEIAATMENGSGDKSALIVGTYGPRVQDPLTVTFSNNKIVLADADINKIKRGDVIIDNNTLVATGTVTVVSRDGKTLTVDPLLASLTGTTISLAFDETLGLIDDKDASGTPVTLDSTANLPY